MKINQHGFKTRWYYKSYRSVSQRKPRGNRQPEPAALIDRPVVPVVMITTSTESASCRKTRPKHENRCMSELEHAVKLRIRVQLGIPSWGS